MDSEWASLVQPQLDALREQNAALLAENASLRGLAEVARVGPGELLQADVRESRIVELSKKLRAATLALDKERGKAIAAEREAALLRKAASAGAREDAARQVVREAAEAAEEAEQRAADMKDKWRDAQRNAEALAAKLATLGAEHERALRALRREVGDDVPVARVLAAVADEDNGVNGGWRGRAQQISLLKDKLRHLKNGGAFGGGATTTSEAGSVFGDVDAPPAAQQRGQARFDTVHRKNLERLEEKRRLDKEEKGEEMQRLRDELDKARQKAEQASSRRVVVEKEMRALKEKMAALLDKSGNDDKLIETLRKALKAGAAGRAGATGGGVPAEAFQQVQARCNELAMQNERQERIVLTLQQQLAQAGPVGGGGISEEDTQALVEENERLEELVKDMRDELQRVERRHAELADEVRSGAAGGAGGAGSGYDGEIRDALDAQKAETQRLREALRTERERSEEELSLYRAMIEEMKGRR